MIAAATGGSTNESRRPRNTLAFREETCVPTPTALECRQSMRASRAAVVVLGLGAALVLPVARTTLADPGTPPAAAQRLPRIDTQAKLERWIARWPNMRQGHGHEVWDEDAAATFPLRARDECLRELHDAGIEATPADPAPIVPMAVTLRTGEIGGVRFQDGHGQPLTYSCDLVSRLIRLSALVKELGITRVIVASGLRDQPRVSFHTLGLAVDVSRYVLADGSDLRVLRDYQRTPDVPTCEATLANPKAQLLQRIACTLHERRVFSSVLTPNYNEGHHDHMHLDWRPGDARFYVR